MQLYVGPCHVVSAEIAVSMAVPIENPAEDVSSRVELFSYTTMHVRILPGRHKSCRVIIVVGWGTILLKVKPFVPIQLSDGRLQAVVCVTVQRRLCEEVNTEHFEHLHH